MIETLVLYMIVIPVIAVLGSAGVWVGYFALDERKHRKD
jgi:hypothetical protein